MIAFSLPLVWITDASWRVSLLIGLLLGVRPWLRRFAGSRAVACLWLLLAARLVMPWPVATRWSLPMPWPAPAAEAAKTAPTSPRSWLARTRVDAAVGGPSGRGASGPSTEANRFVRHRAFAGWDALWLSGAVVATARLVQVWRKTRRWAACPASANQEARLARAWTAIPTALRRGVNVRLTDVLEVPALTGVFRPCIWLPPVWLERLDGEGLRHVLLHELGHVRRHDLAAQWLCALACCVHWFNPLVWWLARAARTDRELACDAWVLARGEENTAGRFGAEYGRTLIQVAARACGASGAYRPLPGAVTMAAGKRQLSLRVREIGAFRARPPWRGIVAGGLVASLVASVVTVGYTAPPPDETAPSPTVSAAPAAPSPAPSRPDESSSGHWGVEVEAKIVSFSGEALRLLQDQQANASSRVKELVDRIAVIAAGKEAGKRDSSLNFAITQLLPKQDFDGLIRGFNQLKGVDLLSAPRVTTRSGQKATVEIIREFIYPTGFDRTPGADNKTVLTPKKFDKKNTGVTLAVEPEIAPAHDVVDLNVSWQLVDLEGWVRMSDGQPVAAVEREPTATQPVFVTQAVDTFVSVPVNTVLVLGTLRQHPGTWSNDLSHPPAPVQTESLVLTFISCTLVDTLAVGSPAPGSGATSPAPSAPAPDAADLPYGVPVPGKPGFVTSPYARDAGYVDVHGFAAGAQVRDPYSQKFFLVP